ncbi:MAG: hypothetical protein QOH06_5817 [Acidobacteriota bacterium]|jgi:hypothetical protein|nr:hypothetical protein [Acidobacteriota bacterium]
MKRPAHVSIEDSGEPAAGEKTREVRIVRKGRLAVAVPVEPSEPLTAETVRRTQQTIRNERERV